MIATTERALRYMVNRCKVAKYLSFDTETNGLEYVGRMVVGYSVHPVVDGLKDEAFYVPMRHNQSGQLFVEYENAPLEHAIPAMHALLRDSTCPIYIHNAPFDLASVRREGLDPASFFDRVHDTQIMQWLIDPEPPKGLKDLVKRFFGYRMATFAETFGKKGNAQRSLIHEAAPYAIDDVYWLSPLAEKLQAELRAAPELWKVYEELERPIIQIVEEMESTGMKVDRKHLNGLTNEFEQAAAEVLGEMQQLWGGPVYPASGKWLAENLIRGRRWWASSGIYGKNGLHSTRAKLVKEWGHGRPAGTTVAGREFAKLLLTHRQMEKLASTYTTSLADVAREDGRVHASFNQSGTVTGRFSSSGPNLQNIPTRTEQGRRIRKAFIAEDGYRLIVADYSQIELRLLAHFSADPVLCQAYIDGADVHQRTADRLGLAKRADAKQFNFGIIYGMGPASLADSTGMTVAEAKKFLAKYFVELPRVKPWMDRTVLLAKQRGYVTTLTKRRRYLRDLQLKGRDEDSRAAYSAAVRRAVNTTIQGSAGDVVKIAMRNIRREAVERGWHGQDMRLLSQVHDELIYEVKADLAEQAAARIKWQMENTVKLRIPLITQPSVVDSWADAKD